MSDKDSFPEAQNELPEVPEKKSSSGCLWISMIVGGIGLFCMLVCCGIIAWFASMFYPTITKVPTEIAAVGHQILDTEIIEDFSPSDARTIDNMFLTFRMAEYKHKEGKGEFLIASGTMKIGDANAMNSDQIHQLGGNSEAEIRGNFKAAKSETHEITVFGQKVNIVVSEGVDRQNEKPGHMATSEFMHGKSVYSFIIRMDDEIWDQDAVFKMLEDAKAQ